MFSEVMIIPADDPHTATAVLQKPRKVSGGKLADFRKIAEPYQIGTQLSEGYDAILQGGQMGRVGILLQKIVTGWPEKAEDTAQDRV